MNSIFLIIFLKFNFLGLLILFLIISYFVSKNSFLPIKDRMNKDLLLIKNKIAQFETTLVPWRLKEIELLSLNTQNEKKSHKGGHLYSTGSFTSIYHEPLFHYGYKIYHSPKFYAILYAKIENTEFYYRAHPNEIEIQINGVPLGRLINDKLYGTDGKMIAHFLEDRIEGFTSVILENKDIAHILDKEKNFNEVNPRAFDLIEQELNQNDLMILSAMAIWKIVHDNIK